MPDVSLVAEADRFAEECHAGAVRRYTGAPYIEHPRRVAAMVAEHFAEDEDLVAAALLHDVVEDCGITVAEIERRFGMAVASVVEALTNPSQGMNLP
jgi:GTP pyrophosphokinase